MSENPQHDSAAFVWKLSSLHAHVQVSEISSNAEFILLVEKDAALIRLEEDRFYKTYPCIILTCQGHPDEATRYVKSQLLEIVLIICSKSN